MSETNPTSICAHGRPSECVDCLRALLDEVTRERNGWAGCAEARLTEWLSARAENAKLREALERIENPIAYLKKRAEDEDASLEWSMAVALSKDGPWLSGIARAALAPEAPPTPSSKEGGAHE